MLSLMATLLAPTLIIYWLGISFFGGKNLTPASKTVGFGIALPSAAVAAMIFAPETTVVSAETMFWQGAAVGAFVGAAAILGIDKRKANTNLPSSNA